MAHANRTWNVARKRPHACLVYESPDGMVRWLAVSDPRITSMPFHSTQGLVHSHNIQGPRTTLSVCTELLPSTSEALTQVTCSTSRIEIHGFCFPASHRSVAALCDQYNRSHRLVYPLSRLTDLELIVVSLQKVPFDFSKHLQAFGLVIGVIR